MSFFNQNKTEFYQEDSLLNIREYVLWKKNKNLYNFMTLPEVAILTIKKNAFTRFLNPFKKRIKGIQGVHYQYNSKFLLSSEFGMGSSSIISMLEELRELGVKRFVFIGVAGIIDKTINENKSFVISNVFSSVGSSFFYSNDENLECFDIDWFQKIKNVCNLTSKTSWSTDCPFRETKSLIENYASKNCSMVDMETAGLYAFSNFHQIPAVSILIGADSFIDNKWKPPVNYEKVMKQKQRLISKIIES